MYGNDKAHIQHKVNELEDIKDNIKGLAHDAMRAIEQLDNAYGRPSAARAKAYWFAHIVCALDNDHMFLGGSMTTMQDSIDEIKREIGEDNEEAEEDEDEE